MIDNNFSTKYRPSTYGEVVGQEVPKAVLKKIAMSPGIACRSIFLKGAWGSGKCVAPDTVVRTDSGLRLVEHLQPGDKFTIGGVKNGIVAVERNKNQEVYNIATKSGKLIKVTGNHPVLVRDAFTYNFKLASNLVIGDKLVQDVSKSEFNYNLDLKAYCTGLFIGCGESLGGFVTLTFEDKNRMLTLARFLTRVFSVYRIIDSSHKRNLWTIEIPKCDSWIRNLVEEGVIDKDVKNLPNSYFKSWSMSEQVSLIEGIIDSIGVKSDNSIEIELSSEEILRGVSYVLNSMGYVTRIISDSKPKLIADKFTYDNQTKDLLSDYIPDTLLDEITSISISNVDYTVDVQCNQVPVFYTNGVITHNTTLSRIFAASMNCEKFLKDGDVCKECDACKESSAKNSQVYMEFDATTAGNIDSIRSLHDKLSFLPPKGYRRVIVLDEIHSCSNSALNALLKLVEEGVPNTIFVFCSTEDILPTLKSRSICLDITTISPAVMKPRLKEVADIEGITITDSELDIICSKSKGHMRDAMSILQLFSLAGPTVLKTPYDLLLKFIIASLKKDKQLANSLIIDIMSYPTTDISSAIALLIKSMFTSESGDSLHSLFKSGIATKLFNYFYSPVSQQAMKSEVGMEILLRSFLERTNPNV